MILRLKLLLAYVLYAIHICYYKISNQRLKIDADIKRWCQELNITGYSTTASLLYLLIHCPQFRNLFYFRVSPRFNFVKKFCPPCSQLQIATYDFEIEGGGLYFEHAHATHVNAKYIGYGCLVRNLTTIGVKSRERNDEKPTIGRNVDFGVGVLCIGNIHLGDNAIIAAGSVVVKDVPSNAIVAGNPAKVIKYRN